MGITSLKSRGKNDTYAIGNSAGKDSLDDDAGTSSTDDAEAKAGAIIDQIDYLYLRPFGIQLKI